MTSRRMLAVAGSLVFFLASHCQAQVHRPYDPADPRPDLIPHPLYESWVPYRKIYNRPRYLGGYLASKIEPTSQEAMAWRDNVNAGLYGSGCKTRAPLYYFPKPWEALEIGARPNPYDPESMARYQQRAADRSGESVAPIAVDRSESEPASPVPNASRQDATDLPPPIQVDPAEVPLELPIQ
ncbi:MAG: hypothetical protein ACKN81_01225 [Pirellulaceae bacterium]